MKHRLGLRTLMILSVICWLLNATLLPAQEQPGDPAHSWLTGKWQGPAPNGGTMEMELRVINNNQVVGSGKVLNVRGSNTYQPEVSGTVNGGEVTLILTNPRSGNNVKYQLSRAENSLKGVRKGESITFEKIQ